MAKAKATPPPTVTDLYELVGPPPENDIHKYIFRMACEVNKGLGDDEHAAKFNLMREALPDDVLRRPVPDDEIEQALINSSPDVYREPKKPFPAKEDARRIEVTTRDHKGALERLQKLSPLDPATLTSDQVISALFPGDPLLCCAPTERVFVTKKRSELENLSRYQFLVPSPMLRPFGLTRSGKKSARCLNNTGPRVYAVIEFDGDTGENGKDLQAAKILHLAKYAPLVMALSSGGKSIHCWLRCDGIAEDKLQEFYAFAKTIKADMATWSRCQLVRMPQATRANGNLQQVLFFNPKLVPVAGLSDSWKVETLNDTDIDLCGLELFFDPHSQRYLYPTGNGWIPMGNDNLEVHLVEHGYRRHIPKGSGELLAPTEKICAMVRTKRHIAYAAPLAGHKAGFKVMNGEPVLVTKSPNLIISHPGLTPLWDAVDEMFIDDELNLDQRPWIWAWQKCAIAAVRSGKFKPGQCLVLVGPKNCGKSLLQGMITHMLGGRSAKPFRYMSEQTAFNSELFAAEHLCVDDEQASYRMDDRTAFATKIKEICVSPSQSCHPKGRPAFTLSPVWRLSMCLNDEPEHLRVIPPLVDGVRDKLLILRVKRRPMPMPTASIAEWDAFGAALQAELPARSHWLDQWPIPDNMLRTDDTNRYGFDTFQHPEIVSILQDMDPESRILEYLRLEMNPATSRFNWGEEKNADGTLRPWIGKAEVLENALIEHYPVLRNILHPGTLGRYLGRLSKRFPNKFQLVRSATDRTWEIQRHL